MSKEKIPENLQIWITARKKHGLSHAQVQMARELGLNPKNFGSLANSRQEPWKMPLPQFIEHLYFKHFGKAAPDRVLTIEETHAAFKRKKLEKQARKLERKQAANNLTLAEQSIPVADQPESDNTLEEQ